MMIDLYSVVSQAGTRDLWICQHPEPGEEDQPRRSSLMLSRLEMGEGFYCQMRVLAQELMPRDARLLLGDVTGLVGIGRLGREDYVFAVLGAFPVTSSVSRIHTVVPLAVSSGRLDGNSLSTMMAMTTATTEDLPPEGSIDALALSIAKLLSSGTFYFHPRSGHAHPDSELDVDEEFLWNGHLLQVTDQLEGVLMHREGDFVHSLFLRVFQGFVGKRQLDGDFRLTVTSRLSCRRAGTRYRARGIDDDGHVANFVESRVELSGEHYTWTYRILRGSVPVFWDQAGFQLGYPRIQLTRSPPATQPAFNVHFDRLRALYGPQHVVDLLSQRDGQAEQLLSSAYAFHINAYNAINSSNDEHDINGNHQSSTNDPNSAADHQESQQSLLSRDNGRGIRRTAFDVHAVCKGNDYSRLAMLMPLVAESMGNFSYGLMASDSGLSLESQKGSFRINCLDCLDRTNLVQGFVISQTLSLFLSSQHTAVPSLERTWNDLWADNGDALSMIYTGSGALRSSFARSGKRTLSGFVDDVRKTATRFYVNTFIDKDRQLAVDLLLGKQQGFQTPVLLFNPGSVALEAELRRRRSEYARTETLTMHCVTWNCAGARPSDLEDLSPLLQHVGQADLVVISLQEVVELNATQIVGGDPERRLKWEQAFGRVLGSRYALLVGHHLVGTTLSLYCRPDFLLSNFSAYSTSPSAVNNNPDSSGTIIDDASNSSSTLNNAATNGNANDASSNASNTASNVTNTGSSSLEERIIRNVELASKKTGLGGMAGNKGSVAVRLDWHDTALCVVASHFAAGREAWEERDREYVNLTQNLQFSKGRGLFSDDAVVLWMGDLNYRLDMLERPQIEQAVAAKTLQALWPFDQLLGSMRDQRAFQGFHEAPIAFAPTYKYDPALDIYDSSEKQRPPAWTDRILAHPPDRTTIRSYGRIDDIRVSDHRAVHATIDIAVTRIDRDARQRIQTELLGERQPPPLPSRRAP